MAKVNWKDQPEEVRWIQNGEGDWVWVPSGPGVPWEPPPGTTLSAPSQDRSTTGESMDSRRQHLDLAERMLTRTGFNDGAYKIDFSGGTPEIRETFDPYKRERGKDWPLYAETMVGARRLEFVKNTLFQLAQDGVRGDFVECGIWRGGVAILAALWEQLFDDGMHVYGLDSFEGLPAPTYAEDDPDDPHHKVNIFSVPKDIVEDNFTKYGVHPRQYTLIQGWFRDTCPKLARELRARVSGIRLLRIDGDMYEGTIDPLKNLYEWVAPGGYVIVDDYGDVRECRKAVDDFRNACFEPMSDLVEFDHTCVYWRKPHDEA